MRLKFRVDHSPHLEASVCFRCTIGQPSIAERCKLIVAADKERRSRNERYFTTTERLNVNPGSQQYQAMNFSMAYS